ncbi:dynamin family protein [Bacillus sp. B190/17]|uniref:Dynamin family protein n=1 Tax=Bacillus lumedeiriae TaxID=3058829 RepID=A0ABW8IBA4_9BACI
MLDETLTKWLANQKPTRSLLLPKLQQLHDVFMRDHDQEQAKICMELIDKLDKMEYVIAFYGHFSAGKSTMINELMGEELLPSSPIPTSANVVKVKEGEPYAKVLFKDQGVKTFPYPYDLSDIQAYCVNGDQVEEVEISHRTGQLPEGTAVFDTPGIDSTDDAHRVSAMSKLHLADLVFYMMDYNHVQSPVNFEFSKQLAERGKDCCFIVNQIDKHVASELSFDEFSQRIRRSFDEHNLSYSGLYFTSLRDDSHPSNQLNELKMLLANKIADRQQEIVHHVLREALIAAMNFFQKQREKANDERSRYEEKLFGIHSLQELEDETERLERQLSTIDTKEQLFSKRFEEELTAVFNNAKLMDYYTRVFVRQFLASRELSFQVRGLFSRKKTKREQEGRLKQLFGALNENRLSYVDIPLREAVLKLLAEYDLLTDERREDIRRRQIDFSPSLLIQLLKSGAVLTDEYVLNYAKDVTHKLKSLYRQSFGALIDSLDMQARTNSQKKKASLLREREEIAEKIDAWKQSKQLQEKEDRLYESLLALLSVRGQEKVEKRPFRAFEKRTSSTGTKSRTFVSIGDAAAKWLEKTKDEGLVPVDLDRHVNELKRKAALLAQAGHMEQMIQALNKRIQRLEKKEYTIALFGAFSAGKSSFANALLGEHVLPVSPNPTTAAINEIRAPDTHHPHGTVTILFKTDEQVLKDINQALELSGKTAWSMNDLHRLLTEHDEIMKSIQKQGEERKETHTKKEELFSPLTALPLEHFSFLRASLAGYKKIKGQLGQSKSSTMEAYTEFVSVEEKACFVERIILYYSSPLTEQGMVLVDTPGAGSMNARHTEIAFTYVTSADSIVFVTYYNHAFSRADQLFLMKLGEVKDFIENNKMFFIVNAADLASTTDDLFDVLLHVDQNLVKCGIHQARIYPISSHLALFAKRQQNQLLTLEERKRYGALLQLPAEAPLPAAEQTLDSSGFSLFERDFYPFTKQALAVSVLRQAQDDMKQAVMELKKRVRLAEENEAEKQRHREDLSQQMKEALAFLHTHSFTAEREALQQELEELLFYVKQRVFYRYNDEYKMIFSPAAFDSFADTMTALHRMTNEIIRFTAKELAHELRTTAFRMQTFVQTSAMEVQRSLQKELTSFLGSVYLKKTDISSFPDFVFDPGLHQLHSGLFQSLFKEYKTALQFFTENGNKIIRDEIEKGLMTPVHHYVNEEGKKIADSFFPFYADLLEQIRKDAVKQIEEQVEGRLAALSQQSYVNQYKKLLAQLQT